MTAEAAFWPHRTRAPGPARWEVALLALCLTLTSLVALAVLWSGDAPYAQIVRPTREQAEVHAVWSAYVTGRSGAQPESERGRWQPTALERSHMADVRGVFIGAEMAAVVAAGIAVWLLLRAAGRGYAARLLRSAALSAIAVVVALGAFAAVAFDAAFLLFHQLFFPQGNFLFPPGSSLIALYPQQYFYALTTRIALSFLALTTVLALLAHLAVRRGVE